jgi:hypothetical protein
VTVFGTPLRDMAVSSYTVLWKEQHTNANSSKDTRKDHVSQQYDTRHSPEDPIMVPGQWMRGAAAPCTQSCLGISDFHLFGPLKWHLYVQKFVNDNVIAVMTTWLHELEQDFFVKGFSALVSCWNKYLNRGGDYIEK